MEKSEMMIWRTCRGESLAQAASSGSSLAANWIRLLFAMLFALTATGCDARLPQDEMVGVGITGIDHLPDHLSIQDFWVDGYNAFRAGQGSGTVCCAMLPAHWRPGLTVQVRWGITNWRDKTYSMHEATVPVERYDEVGRLWVHFLKDGSVRVVSSNLAAWKQHADYPGPHDPIPQKEPWKMYPRSEGEPLFREVEDASKEVDDGRNR